MNNVLHVINGEYFAGAERVQDHLALGMTAYGWNCEFLAIKDGVFGDYRESSSRIVKMNVKDILKLRMSSQYIKDLKELNVQVVHSHSPITGVMALWISRLLGVKVVYHVHSPSRKDTENKIKNFVKSCIEEYVVFKKVNRIIAVSDDIDKYLRKVGAPSSKICVVYNGVPVREISNKKNSAELVIGCVGLFRERKGLEVLLKSYKTVLISCPQAKLHIIGTFSDQEYAESMQMLTDRLGIQDKVNWVGFTDDVLSEMRELDLFVLPSTHGEGLPMVIIEAMSIGLPIVATDVEGVKQAVVNGETGCIVNPGSHEQMADIVIRLLSDRESMESMSFKAKERQEELFSDKAMTEKVCKVYNDLI